VWHISLALFSNRPNFLTHLKRGKYYMQKSVSGLLTPKTEILKTNTQRAPNAHFALIYQQYVSVKKNFVGLYFDLVKPLPHFTVI